MKAEFVLLVEAEVENVRIPKTSLANDRHIKRASVKMPSSAIEKLDTANRQSKVRKGQNNER